VKIGFKEGDKAVASHTKPREGVASSSGCLRAGTKRVGGSSVVCLSFVRLILQLLTHQGVPPTAYRIRPLGNAHE
jgi:hypothetical protein